MIVLWGGRCQGLFRCRSDVRRTIGQTAAIVFSRRHPGGNRGHDGQAVALLGKASGAARRVHQKHEDRQVRPKSAWLPLSEVDSLAQSAVEARGGPRRRPNLA